MSGQLETAARQFFDLLDGKDADAIIRAGAKDIQGIDEISRRWQRGSDEFGAYVRQTLPLVDDVQTTINEVHETVQGDIGLMTCWIEQDYTFQGKRQHVSAPTTVAFRREGGTWKVLLFHSVPMAAAET